MASGKSWGIGKLLGGAFSGRRPQASPTSTLGVAGTVVMNGVVQEEELNAELRGSRKYKTFGDMLANTSIVAAGVRYYLNLTAHAAWTMEPSDEDPDGEWADKAMTMLLEDPITPWHRIVRRAAMYRFYGFSIQEWTAFRRDDGVLSLHDVEARPQRTIERWDVDEVGNVLGVVQRSPLSQQELYLPRGKVVYAVDDTLNDSPEGFGLLRHVVPGAKRLGHLKRIEGIGLETDLRGMPVGYGPFTELAKMVESGALTAADRTRIEKPMRDFIQNHIKGPALGMLLDSAPYESKDDAARPSSIQQWRLELLKANATGLEEVGAAIARETRELARLLGVEQLLLGESSVGSHALSKDKTQSLFLMVNGTLRELEEVMDRDLLTPLWALNGWDPALKPRPSTEAIRFQDVEEMATVLRDMATAGAILEPDDPAIGEIRDLLGLSRPPERELEEEDEDASLLGSPDAATGTGEEEDEVVDPEDRQE